MGNFGSKHSRIEVDVKLAADTQLVFNTAWNFLKIYSEAEYIFTDSGASGNILLTNHGLGFVPLFIYLVKKGSTWVWPDTLTNKGVRIDSSDVRWYKNNDNLGSITIRLVVFRNRMLTAYSAPIIDTSTNSSSGSSPNFGTKMSIEGVDVKSANNNQLVMSSIFSSLPIHKITSGNLNSGTITIAHGLGYRPTSIWYAHITGGSNGYAMISMADDSQTAVDLTNCQLYLPYTGEYGLLVLKDPLLTDA